MLGSYVWRDLTRNPRRTIAAMLGIALGVGQFSAVLFFIDGSAASMTHRAIEPLPLDMQRVLAAPLGRTLELSQSTGPTGAATSGSVVTVSLVVTNRGPVPAHEVVVRAPFPRDLAYLAGSTTRNGAAVPDIGTENPLAAGAAQTGLNVGTIAPGTAVTLTSMARARGAKRSASDFPVQATVSSREVVVPIRANAAPALALEPLTRRIARVPGVASARGLSFVDLATGALRGVSAVPPGPVRVFAFDASYVHTTDSIRIVSGGFRPGHALVSADAASAMRLGLGDPISIQIPGRTDPISLPVGGIVDLARAKALFFSRQGRNLEDFLSIPYSVVVPPRFFTDQVIPAFRTATATRGDLVRSRPIQEVDVQIARARLDADPGTALAQTRAVARAVRAVATGSDTLIDNISNTLGVARGDAAVAKRMFIVLGVPGALVAAMLAAYAGALLADAQRREQAVLRVRGAGQRQLLWLLALRTVFVSGIGVSVGLMVGFVSAQAVLGVDALARATTAGLVISAAISAGSGFLVTGAALFVTGRRAIRRDIHDERTQISRSAPGWWRLRLDMIGLAAAAIAAVVAFRTHAFDGVPGSVYDGRGVTVRLELVALPIAVWIAGSLAAGRCFVALAGRGRASRGGRVVSGTFARSIGRRPWAAAGGMVMAAMIVALGMSVAAFTASYDRAKVTDARFGLGSDLRITPSPSGTKTDRPIDLARLTGGAVRTVTPVVFGIANAVLHSPDTEDAVNLAAVEPQGYRRVAPMRDADFVDATASQAMAALERDPKGLLVDAETADFLALSTGDRVETTLSRGTRRQVHVAMHILGRFDRLPGFPEGAGALMNLTEYRTLVARTRPDFLLAETAHHSAAAVNHAVATLRSGRNVDGSLQVDSWVTTRAKDQSSLAALNIDGLLTLDFAYALAMVTVAITMFVFGLLLQRRREYVTLRAQGMHRREIRRLILLETGAVAGFGFAAGIVVGMAMANLLVHALRPLFVVAPSVALPVGSSARLGVLVLLATAVASLAASALVNRLRPTELLRDE